MAGIEQGLIALAAGLAVGAGAIATALVQSSIGAAGMGLMAEKDNKDTQVLIMLALPETLVLFGTVVAYLILTNWA
ncbi:MAG: ATPase [Candidatus Micrarchaeota archaeon]